MRERFIPAVIKPELCVACGRCYRACPNQAIYFVGPTRNIDYSKCKGCLLCVNVCGQNAISVTNVYRDGVFAISVDQAKCTGGECGACIEACPQRLYFLVGEDRPGQKICVQTDTARLAECRGCHACEEACPNDAIKVLEYREKNVNKRSS
ncbi:MAG TPA: 4Fe-4S binding protein [Candidatus Lokiarchaeia archaeon]|nr:4Fe-4S binding protein [Candidatus Lokiarchaeia archaeon]